MTRTISALEGLLYSAWLDGLYRAANPDHPRMFTDEYDEEAHRWRVAEVSRGRDFPSEWDTQKDAWSGPDRGIPR